MGTDGSCFATVTVRLPDGLHVALAYELAALIKTFDAKVSMRSWRREQAIRNGNDLLKLALRDGDSVDVSCSGSDAQALLDAVKGFLSGI